jgi:pimeloyl-ACP methyl ester carboxylesterase
MVSIQMPVLAQDAGYEAYPQVFPEAVERLQLTVAYLKAKGYRRIAIVSHSDGSRMTRAYMAENPTDVRAWVAISLTRGDTFDGVKAPVLDLYGGNDLPHVLSAAAKRKASLNNAASKQMVILGADHFYTGREEAMVKAVKDFLDGLK